MFKRFLLVGLFSVLAMVMAGCEEEVEGIIDGFTDNSEEVEGEEENESVDTEDLDGMEVHFIDVGQADAILMEYNDDGEDYNVMVDSGDWNATDAIDYLDEQGIEELDLLVGSHEHADHIGQMDKIIEELEVGEVWLPGNDTDSAVYERMMDAIDDNGVEYNEPRSGEEYEVGSLDIDVVAPDSLTGDLNDDSIVMNVSYGNVDMLLTGDAEENAEKGMLERGENIQADILKSGHHGSDTSSTDDFVEEVGADVAIMQVGEDNKYSHPMQSVLDRYENNGMDMYATKDNGNIVISTDGDSFEVAVEEEADVTAESD